MHPQVLSSEGSGVVRSSPGMGTHDPLRPHASPAAFRSSLVLVLLHLLLPGFNVLRGLNSLLPWVKS